MGFTNKKKTIILSLAMALVLAEVVNSQDSDEADALYRNLRSGISGRRRFLESPAEPKSGAVCHRKNKKVENICDGVLTNNGTTLLQCCSSRCRSILEDVNNCGKCKRKCAFGRLCCTGRCINISDNKNNCGACGRKCKKGRPCELGLCGYA